LKLVLFVILAAALVGSVSGEPQASAPNVSIAVFGCDSDSRQPPTLLLRHGADYSPEPAPIRSRMVEVAPSVFRGEVRLPVGHNVLIATQRRCRSFYLPVTVIEGHSRNVQLVMSHNALVRTTESARSLIFILPIGVGSAALLYSNGQPAGSVALDEGVVYADNVLPEKVTLRVSFSDGFFHVDIPFDMSNKRDGTLSIVNVSFSDLMAGLKCRSGLPVNSC